MKQDVQEVINGLPEAARVLVLAKVQEWQAFAGDLVKVDEQVVSDGLKFVLTFKYGSVGTVITPTSA
jgi:hypothetical protein